LLAQLVEQRTL